MVGRDVSRVFDRELVDPGGEALSLDVRTFANPPMRSPGLRRGDRGSCQARGTGHQLLRMSSVRRPPDGVIEPGGL